MHLQREKSDSNTVARQQPSFPVLNAPKEKPPQSMHPLRRGNQRSASVEATNQDVGPRHNTGPPIAGLSIPLPSTRTGKSAACEASASVEDHPYVAAMDQAWMTKNVSDLSFGPEMECNVHSLDALTTSNEAPATSWWPQHSLEGEQPPLHPTVHIGDREIILQDRRASSGPALEPSQQFSGRPCKEQAAGERRMAEFTEAELRSYRVVGQTMPKGTHPFPLMHRSGSWSRRQLSPKDLKPTSPLLVLTFCSGSCVVALGVTLVLFLAMVAIKRRPPVAPEVCRSHACAEFSRRLRESINESACPCKSFTSFVCDGWRQDHKLSVREESFKATLDRISRLTSALSSEHDLGSEPAASTFFRSCESIFKGTSDETAAVTEALREAGIVWPRRASEPVDALQAVFYSSLKLRWSTVLHAELDELDGKTRVLLTPADAFAVPLEKALALRGQALARSDYFDLLNRNFDDSSTQAQDSVKLEETIQVEEKFLMPLDKAFRSPSRRDVLSTRSLFIENANLTKERWSEVLNAHGANISREVIYWTENAEFIEQFFTLWLEHGEWDAFLLLSWCTVQLAALYANRHLIVNYYGDEHKAAVLHGSFCLRKTYLIAGNAAFFYYHTDVLFPRSRTSAESLTIAVREAFLRRVERWRYYDKNATIVPEWNSTARVFAVIDGKYAVKYTSDAKRLPNMTASFVQNWQIAVVPYAHYASNAVYDAIRHLKLHAQFEGDFTLLPYAFSFPLYAEDASNTMNLAGVGREMTRALSELFLEAYSASRGARQAFTELNECLEAPDAEASLLEFLTLDALSEAHNSFGFHAGRRLISLQKYSPSQLFFIAACYSTCRGSLDRGSHNHCDIALRHLKSFSDAFLCSFETPTGPKKTCSL